MYRVKVIELSMLNSVAFHVHTRDFSCECCAKGGELCIVFCQMFIVELQSECKAKHVPVVLQIWCLVLLNELQVWVIVSHGPVLVCKQLGKTVSKPDSTPFSSLVCQIRGSRDDQGCSLEKCVNLTIFLSTYSEYF
jgi:hypothetical protein